jgi:hypothetical protein
MVKYIYKLIVFFIVVSVVMDGCKGVAMTKNEMLSAAVKKAQELGYWNPSYAYEAVYDEGNKEWKQVWEPLREPDDETFKILQGRNYQAIWCRPKDWKNMLDGNLWVFFDTDTGEIITYYGD